MESGQLEIEELIPEKLLGDVNNFIDQEMPKHPKGQKRYIAGRDLWRRSPAVKKIVLRSTLAELAKQLREENELFLGFDQLFESAQIEQASLEQLFSVKPLSVGLMIFLKGERAGSGRFIHPKNSLNWDEKEPFIVIGYAKQGAIYHENSDDLGTDFLKQFNMRDRHPLKDPLHPKV